MHLLACSLHRSWFHAICSNHPHIPDCNTRYPTIAHSLARPFAISQTRLIIARLWWLNSVLSSAWRRFLKRYRLVFRWSMMYWWGDKIADTGEFSFLITSIALCWWVEYVCFFFTDCAFYYFLFLPSFFAFLIFFLSQWFETTTRAQHHMPFSRTFLRKQAPKHCRFLTISRSPPSLTPCMKIMLCVILSQLMYMCTLCAGITRTNQLIWNKFLFLTYAMFI